MIDTELRKRESEEERGNNMFCTLVMGIWEGGCKMAVMVGGTSSVMVMDGWISGKILKDGWWTKMQLQDAHSGYRV